MKVRIDETLEVSDEQLVMIADLLDKKQSKRKATRKEARAYLWAAGEQWAMMLFDDWSAHFNPSEPTLDDGMALI